jgi:serine/threonine protein kinase
MVLKYCADICKGLSILHNTGFVHGSIKPSNMYLDRKNSVMLGELGRTKLECSLKTHALFSRVLIADAIPKTLIYWAPELLSGNKPSFKTDIWALGVSIY